jgi:hypothetical protein
MKRKTEALRTAATFFVLTAAVFALTAFADIKTLERVDLVFWSEIFVLAALPVFELVMEKRAALKRGMHRGIFFLMYCTGYGLSLFGAYIWIFCTNLSRFFTEAETEEEDWLGLGLVAVWLIMLFGALWALVFRGAAFVVKYFIEKKKN